MGMIKDNIERARRIYYAEQYRKTIRDAVPFLLNIDKLAYARELGTGGRIKIFANQVEYPRETMEKIGQIITEFFNLLDPDLKIYISKYNEGDDSVVMYYTVLKDNKDYDIQIHLESFDEQKKSILPDPDPDLMPEHQRKKYTKTYKYTDEQTEERKKAKLVDPDPDLVDSWTKG